MKDVRKMSLEELKKLSPEDLLSLSESDKLYVSDRFKKSMTEKAWFDAAKKLDTGIYDADGNLIGDKYEEEDDYEWD